MLLKLRVMIYRDEIVSLARGIVLIGYSHPKARYFLFARPRQLIHALLYLLHPCSRKESIQRKGRSMPLVSCVSQFFWGLPEGMSPISPATCGIPSGYSRQNFRCSARHKGMGTNRSKHELKSGCRYRSSDRSYFFRDDCRMQKSLNPLHVRMDAFFIKIKFV